MKKVIVLFTIFTLLFSSCKSRQNSNFSDADIPNENDDTSSVWNSQPAAQIDKPVSKQDAAKESLFKISDIKICSVGDAEGNMQTYEEVKDEYPGKTVLVWQLNPLITPPSSKAVNRHLDSLGKEYVICFKDAPPNYRDSRYSEALSYSTYNETVTKRLESGEQIDIIDAFSVYNELSLHGFLEPIDSYLLDTAVGQKLYDLMPDNYWKGCQVNGHIYGVCSYLTLGKRSGYLVNSVLADKYGYDTTKPILEQLDILERIKKEPCDPVMTWKGFSQSSECSTGKILEKCVFWDDAAESWASILCDKEYTETLRTYFELGKMGMVRLSPAQNSYFIYEQNNQYLPDHKSFEQIYGQAGNGFVTVPSYIASPSGTYVKQSGTGVGISASSEYKDLAFDLIATAYTDPDLNNMLCYGENYGDYIQNNGIYLLGNDLCRTWVFFNPVISIRPGTEPENLTEAWINGLEAAKVSDNIDFYADLSEFEDTKDAIFAVSVEMSRKAVTDEYNDFEEYLNEYFKRLDEAGQQAIIDEVNRQYADYKEHKNG